MGIVKGVAYVAAIGAALGVAATAAVMILGITVTYINQRH